MGRLLPSELLHNPYLQLIGSALLLTAAEILLKVGATGAASSGLFNLEALGHLPTWAGIALYIASFAIWLNVLRTMPVSVAYAMSSLVHLTVPIAAWMFLGEHIGPNRMAGIALVFAGTLLVAVPTASAEKHL